MLSNLQIRLQNFKSYLDSGWISLDGKNVLVGTDSRGYSNGSGKSSILDALSLFLDNNWTNYNKSEVATLTNINSPKKAYIIISLSCLIDDQEFKAEISGADAFIFKGDQFLLSKFQQELTGSIMNQGLINNLADFDRRSQLDAYIDQFYKVRDILAKLKDFQTSTIEQLNLKLSEIDQNLAKVNDTLETLSQENYIYKGQIMGYMDCANVDINVLESENKKVSEALKSLYMDFSGIRKQLNEEKQRISSRMTELQEASKVGEKIEALNFEKNKHISEVKQKYITECGKLIENEVNSWLKNIKNNYSSQYLSDLENKRRARTQKLIEIMSQITSLSSRTPGYVLNEFEINEVNIAVREWCPQSFKLGTTYKQVMDSLSWFSKNVREVIEKDSKEVIDLRNEYNSMPEVSTEKTEKQIFVDNLYISVAPVSLKGSVSSKFFLYWDYNFETSKFEVESNLPSSEELEAVLDIDIILSKIPPLVIDTRYWDNQISSLENSVSSEGLSEINDLSVAMTNVDKQLSELSDKELEYNRQWGYYQEVVNSVSKYNKYIELSNGISRVAEETKVENEKLEDLKKEYETYKKRKEDLNKIIDSVSKYSGEELRNEFGFKLAKLSSMILNDVFNLDGTISLDSNGTRTVFKYNDGNGFLSFKVLSGGQLQKIKLAINLSLLLFFYKDRQYIFLDEVFQHLDNPSKEMLINYIVKDLGIKNILLIQHDTLKFEGFKEIRVYRDEHKNTKIA